MTINHRAMQDGNVYGIVNLTRIRMDQAAIQLRQDEEDDEDEWVRGVLAAYSYVLGNAVLVEEL